MLMEPMQSNNSVEPNTKYSNYIKLQFKALKHNKIQNNILN